MWSDGSQSLIVRPDSSVTWGGDGPACGTSWRYVVNGWFHARGDSLTMSGGTSFYCNFAYEGGASFSARFDSTYTTLVGRAHATRWAYCAESCNDDVLWSIRFVKVHDVP